MKLIWFSVAPWANTGYGVITREIVPRLQAEGHEIWIATKHFHTGVIEWHGCPVFNGMDLDVVNRRVAHDSVDHIITLLDIFTLKKTLLNWICYCPIDTQWILPSIAAKLKDASLRLAVTKHGQSEMERVGFNSMYVPCGVNTSIYKPDEEKRQETRAKLGWQDNFIVGSLGINYGDERKNYMSLLMGFKLFHDVHPDVRLYLSTNPKDETGQWNLPAIASELHIDEFIQYSNYDEHVLGRVFEEQIANRYRAFDICCLPTKGEGFGLPILEAQVCGTPVITTATTSGPELLKGGWLISPDKDDWEWHGNSWRPKVTASAVAEKLELAYQAWQEGKLKDIGLQGSEGLQEYDWDNVFETYWKPVLAELPRLKCKVQHYPDYRSIAEFFTGRIMMADCGLLCKDKPCNIKFPLLPGEESKVARPLLSRSYPIRPGVDGKLMVDTGCPMHKWLSKRFMAECERAWAYLWGFPVVRRFIRDYSGPGVSEYIKVSEITRDFDEEYKWAMQSIYRTNAPNLNAYIPENGTVLEVGCGDGRRVKALQDAGFNAIGVEINDAWLKDELVLKGDAEQLLFDDDSFDVVISIDLLEHLEHPLKVLAEMFRVSKDKVIAFVTPSEDRTFWEDPTHKVEWDIQRWMRELNEFGEIIDRLKPTGFIMKKRR